jgi:hypothetical protein
MTYFLGTLPIAAALATVAVAQVGPEPRWIVQFGTHLQDGGHSVASDRAGGVFVAGSTLGNLPGPNPNPTGGAFLIRFDGAGSPIWIRQFGGDASAHFVAPDGEGGALVAGSIENPALPFALDAFITRYDASGNQLWFRRLEGFSLPHSVASDEIGGMYVASYGRGNNSTINARLGRFDAQGNEIWIRQFGTDADDYSYSAVPDGAGGAFVAGFTVRNRGQTNAQTNAWLAHYDRDGNESWIRRFGTVDTDAYMAAPDGDGGALIAGRTGESLGGPHTGRLDVWLARVDIDGNPLWVRQFGTSDSDSARAVTADGFGGAFVTGWTKGGFHGPPSGNDDGFLARFSADGDHLWTSQFGTPAREWAFSVAAGSAGGAFVAGVTGGSFGGANLGMNDAFLAYFASGLCYPDCDGSGMLDVFDFLCFQNVFLAADPYADCDGDGMLSFQDFVYFQTEFLAGCP